MAAYTMPTHLPQRFVKAVLLGNSGVGKTQLVIAMQLEPQDDLNVRDLESQGPTIGVSFAIFYIPVSATLQFKLQLWDTAGQERFHSLGSNYIRSSQILLLVFDITDRKSFEGIQSRWLPEVEKHRANPDTRSLVVYLIGMKRDLAYNRAVSYADALNFASRNELVYSEQTALDRQGVAALVTDFSMRLHNIHLEQGISDVHVPENLNLLRLVDGRHAAGRKKCC